MKIDRKQLFQQIKTFLIKYHIPIILILGAVGGIFGFTAMVMVNQTSSFCQKCHQNRGKFYSIDLRIPAHAEVEKGGASCLSCHTDKALEIQALRSIRKTPKFSQRLANLEMLDRVSSKDTYPTEKCLACHPQILELEEVDEPNLPFQVQHLGLRFDHQTHYRFSTFQPEDELRWKTLRLADQLTPEESEEFELLEKIRLGNCEICHIQTKLDEFGKPYIDKTVNYTARNPIDCNGCHEQARPNSHPGEDMSSPTKEVCFKCHHGKLHGKFEIFLADCEGGKGQENCVKCHPLYDENKYFNLVQR
ncbi:MAG: hypothetical protein SCK70_15245 [bacterium]|nr:hypothetical protein [bacterium]